MHAAKTAKPASPAGSPDRPRAARPPVAGALALEPPQSGALVVTAAPRSLQPKLVVGAANDPLEHEADRIAAQVMGVADTSPSVTPAPPRVARACSACEDERVHRKVGALADPGSRTAPPSVHDVLARPGQSLDPATRSFFETRFGRDFGGVRVHSDAPAARSARDIGARAYAVGQDIVFADGGYRPHDATGRALIAHELAHVAQQTPGVVRRAPNTGAPAAADPAAPPAADPDVTLVHDRVQRIVISCSEGKGGRLSIETRSSSHHYALTACDASVAPGKYSADVKVDKKANNVGFLLHTGGGARQLFKGQFAVRRGQLSPVELMTDQDNVPVVYGPHIPGGAGVPPPECLVTLEPRQIFPGGTQKKDLTHLLPKVPVLKWPLAEWGIADVTLSLGVVATAAAGYSYEPGMLSDICLSPTIKHPFAGHARFAMKGQADLHLDITVGAELSADILGVFPVLSAHGELKLDLDAAVGGQFDALVEIAHNPMKPGEFGLRSEIELAALTAFDYNLSGSAGIDFLGFNLWQGSLPSIVKGGLGYGWTGGLQFTDSFKPEPMMGTFAKAAPGQMTTGALRTHGPKRPTQAKDSIPIKELVEASIHDKQGNLVMDGLSCDRALPLHWFKPRSLYPQKLAFSAPGVFPTEIKQDDAPTLVSHPDVPTWKFRGRQRLPGDPVTGPTPIGVSGDNWPESGKWAKCFQYLPMPASRTESDNFRELLKGLGTTFDGLTPADGRVQMDHIRELQFGGKDRFDNLWPYDASANGSAGPLHAKQIQEYAKLFKGGINGRYFTISGVGLDPGLAAKIGT
jgi:hypothetical protein